VFICYIQYFLLNVLYRVQSVLLIVKGLNINSYGKEDMSHITDTFKNQMINSSYKMIQKMIEQVHFNKEKPENKNILLPNKRKTK